jgi:hypothetical protein
MTPVKKGDFTAKDAEDAEEFRRKSLRLSVLSAVQKSFLHR